MNISQLLIRSIFAFIVLLMPMIVLEPMDDSVYGFTDFFGYYSQARLITKQPGQDMYDPEKLIAHARELYPPLQSHGAYYIAEPPVAQTFLLPTAVFPKEYSLITAKVLLTMFTALSLALLAVTFEQSERQFLATTVIVALSGPFWEATRVTKPGLIVLLGLSLSLWRLRNYKTLSAAVCMLPWTIRPQLFLFFFAELLGARKLKFLTYVAAASIVLTLITLPLFGLVNYESWYNHLQYMSTHHEITGPFLHPTIRGQLMRFALPEQVISAVSVASFGATLALAIYLGHRFKSSRRWLQLSTACMPLGVVLGPYCHNYDLVILIPSIIAFFKSPFIANLPKPLRFTCLGLVSLCLLCFEMPVYHRIHYDFLQKNILTISPLFVSLLVLSIIFVYASWKESAQAEET